MSQNKSFRYSDLGKETFHFPKRQIWKWETRPEDIIVLDQPIGVKNKIDFDKELEQARQLILECLQERKRKREEDTEEDTE